MNLSYALTVEEAVIHYVTMIDPTTIDDPFVVDMYASICSELDEVMLEMVEMSRKTSDELAEELEALEEQIDGTVMWPTFPESRLFND